MAQKLAPTMSSMETLPHGHDGDGLADADVISHGGAFGPWCKVQIARGGMNSLFKNLQTSLNNHVSIKRWLR
jgi:hypothetical protein